MRLSRQQKVYLAILAVTCGGLVVDRLFLRGQTVTAQGPAPASAEASPLPGEPNLQTIDRPIGPARGGPDPNLPSPSMKLAQRLEMLWQEEGLDLDEARDAFSLPPAWRASASAQNPMAGDNAALRFASNHRLKAVLVDGKMRYAWVDNHLLILGQELDGFKLIAVDEDSATFAPLLAFARKQGGKQVVLKLTNDR